jgi:competence protein ComEC
MAQTDIYILNVGAGDTSVIRSPSGNVTMVDVNDGQEQRNYEPEPSDRDLVDAVEWYKQNIGAQVFRFILTHPDADHMAGIRRVLLGELSVLNFWDIPHKRVRNEDDCRTEKAWHDWAVYDTFRRGGAIDGISWPKKINPFRNDEGEYWTADNIEILSPTPTLVAEADDSDEYNNASYVITVSHGNSRILLTGDVEEKAWNDMIEAGTPLRANVLVASHHGRKSGFSKEAMEAIKPNVVIMSTAKLPPEHDAINHYKGHCKLVFSTRTYGNIAMSLFDNGDVYIYDQDGELLVRLYDTVSPAAS